MKSAPSSANRVEPGEVELRPVDEPMLVRLLATAVAEADPSEVMAPVAGPAGWTPERQEAFVAYHRSRRASGTNRPVPEVTLAVTVDESVVGALRLAAVDEDAAALEMGLWLGRRYRDRGIGRAVLTPAADTAKRIGARRLVARTTATNSAAVAVLVAEGFQVVTAADGTVEAALLLD